MSAIGKEDIEFLKDLQNEMLTQDHVCQAAPRFWVVRGTVKEYGYDKEYADTYELVCDKEDFSTIDNMEDAFYWLLNEERIACRFYKDSDEIIFDDENGEEIECIQDLETLSEYLVDNHDLECYIVYYKEVEKNFENTMFLTIEECKKHIELNHYHYPADAHSYAMTAWRAPKVERLFSILEKMDWDEIENKCLK